MFEQYVIKALKIPFLFKHRVLFIVIPVPFTAGLRLRGQFFTLDALHDRTVGMLCVYIEMAPWV